MVRLSSLLVVLTHILSFSPGNVSADGCKEMDFKVTIKDKTLANHVFKTARATDDAHCESQCFLDDRCISYCFRTTADGQTNMCELSDSDHVMHPKDMVRRANVIYRSAENSCTCRGKQTCRYDFVQKRGQCVCPERHFTGHDCTTAINYCISGPCQHQGTCVTDQVNGGYTCQCHAGTSGVHCETNFDECASSPCVNGTCVDQINAFRCNCVPGYTGPTCNIDIDECASIPCRHGATCSTNKVNAYDCECTPKYYGTICEYLDHCLGYPCQNGGTCIDKTHLAGHCRCTSDYQGFSCQYLKYCESHTNPCTNPSYNKCVNNLADGYVCYCSDGYYLNWNHQCVRWSKK